MAEERENVFYGYLMTEEKMFQIVKEKHKENAAKEAKAQKKEQCFKTALAKLRQEQRKTKKESYYQRKFKKNPQL